MARRSKQDTRTKAHHGNNYGTRTPSTTDFSANATRYGFVFLYFLFILYELWTDTDIGLRTDFLGLVFLLCTSTGIGQLGRSYVARTLASLSTRNTAAPPLAPERESTMTSVRARGGNKNISPRTHFLFLCICISRSAMLIWTLDPDGLLLAYKTFEKYVYFLCIFIQTYGLEKRTHPLYIKPQKNTEPQKPAREPDIRDIATRRDFGAQATPGLAKRPGLASVLNIQQTAPTRIEPSHSASARNQVTRHRPAPDLGLLSDMSRDLPRGSVQENRITPAGFEPATSAPSTRTYGASPIADKPPAVHHNPPPEKSEKSRKYSSDIQTGTQGYYQTALATQASEDPRRLTEMLKDEEDIERISDLVPLATPGRGESAIAWDSMLPRYCEARPLCGSENVVNEKEWKGLYVTVMEEEDAGSPNAPLLYTVAMEDFLATLEDDDDIICMDGEELFAACKPMHLPEVFAAYKRVDRKVKPVPAVFPEDARVERHFPEEPLDSLPELPTHPPQFIPNGGRLTTERMEEMKINEDGFLWPEEEKLFKHILQTHQDHFVWEDHERGSFREDYFTPYIIPVVPHIPWAFPNIPIPQGILDQVVQLLREKMEAGVYESSQSSYRSRWFCVRKKNGKLRIVHDLQPLNKVTIRDAGLPPNLDSFVEPFAGHQCYTVFDLYWGFDARKVHPRSRDLTAFMTPLGLLRITSLPTGFTNSPAEFQACMSFILQHEIPHKANIFIDDLPIKGPASQYKDQNGQPEVLAANPGIRRFIWEHANDVHRIVHRVGHAGGTFSPAKVQLARPEVLIVGQKCTPEGRLPDTQKVEKVLNWPPLKTVKDVRAFLGLCGTVRIWIENYSVKARPLTELIRRGTEFIWDARREEAFSTLKKAITSAPALRQIDHKSDRPVILAVDSSYIAVGFILSQIDEEGRRRPARYGSIPMNEREARYSQPKLELYGLFRALRAWRIHLIGVKKLIVEVDAKYIKGMLNDPDLQPNAAINRWIQGILLFDFELVHVPAAKHRGPDALSRKERAEGESMEEEDDSWLDDIALFAHATATHPLSTWQQGEWDLYHVQTEPEDMKQLRIYASVLPKPEQTLVDIYDFLRTLQTPPFDSIQEKNRFIKKSLKYFVKGPAMYRRNPHGIPTKCIFRQEKRNAILEAAHERLGHRGELATFQTVKQRFYWPGLWNDVRHHVRSCHQCQIRALRKAEVPIMVSTPATLFVKIYLDIMHMPKAQAYVCIIAGKDDLSGVSEGRPLRNKKAEAVSKFFWEQILCRYGAVGWVVTDNGPEFMGAYSLLMDRYHLPHIKISAYNSKANGVVERGHFIIREAILKSCEGRIKEWPDYVSHAFFADRVTVRQQTGYSPYYLLHGTHPVLPFDLVEASFMVDGFTRNMETSDLLALRIRQLQKRPEDVAKAAQTMKALRIKSKIRFKERYRARMINKSLAPGTLVLIRNTAVEKSLDKKSKSCYFGLYEIVQRTTGGSYIIKELDGAHWRTGIAAFRLIPYVARGNKEELKKLATDLSKIDPVPSLEELERRNDEEERTDDEEGEDSSSEVLEDSESN